MKKLISVSAKPAAAQLEDSYDGITQQYYCGGFNQTATYDALGRLTGMVTAAGSVPAADIAYKYDAASNILIPL